MWYITVFYHFIVHIFLFFHLYKATWPKLKCEALQSVQIIKILVFQNVKPFSLVDGYQCFGRAYSEDHSPSIDHCNDLNLNVTLLKWFAQYIRWISNYFSHADVLCCTSCEGMQLVAAYHIVSVYNTLLHCVHSVHWQPVK